MRRFPDSAFFKIADGFGGHTQILALFDRHKEPGYSGLSAERTTVDHIAFAIALKDFEAERARLEGLGLKLEFAKHEWVHWRSLYVRDPEGNSVELVCYDPSV
jgi:catechol 2,3-dioxygenase